MFPKLNTQSKRISDSALKRRQAKDCNGHHHLRDVVDEGVEEARPKARKPVEMLGRMMPGMRPPEDCEAMLGAMNPVNDEIDHQDSEPDSHHEWQFFQLGRNRGSPGDMTTGAVGDQAGANPVGDDGEDKR